MSIDVSVFDTVCLAAMAADRLICLGSLVCAFTDSLINGKKERFNINLDDTAFTKKRSPVRVFFLPNYDYVAIVCYSDC